ncbi:MAG TPA: phage holin family protein [Chloroflexota bacterium]|nr:phage holin family protein [Chloroflexota bacterium]
MRTFVLRLALNALALLVIANVVPGIHVEPLSALVAALVLGAVNAVVRPVLILLTLPVTIVTLGLFLLVINAGMFGLAAWLVPGFAVNGFGAALLGSILYWMAGWITSHFIHGGRRLRGRHRVDVIEGHVVHH